MSRKDWIVLGGLTLFSAVVLFFISPDSYFNDMHTRADSAWFFMCGKAWMNGLVPYVDFADSKGPLLWLIYGLGYLLSPTSYVGVYWISCLWYGLTFFFTYKTAAVFLQDSRKSLVCALLMTLAFFNPWFHEEIRAEDFCLLFLVLSLYRTCLLLYAERLGEKEIHWSFGILGACFAALFLIKFNIAAMQAVLILGTLYWLLREKRSWLKPFLYGLCGFGAVTVPFLIYFLIAGNFPAFIQEYILNTLQTVGEAALRREGKYRWMPLLVSLAIFALAIRHHFLYYFNSCSFLLLFLVVGIVSLFGKPLPRWAVPLTALAVVSIAIPFHILTYNFKILFFNDNINQRDYYRAAYIMSQVKSPKLVNAYGHEYGFGVPAETLPAGKYWTKQNGMTAEMMAEHNALILSGRADFILINEAAWTRSECVSEQQLADAGYVECCRLGEGQDLILLSKRHDLEIPDRVSVSLSKLFLKQKPFSHENFPID